MRTHLSLAALFSLGLTASAYAQTTNPAYFMPPASGVQGPDSPVLESHPIPNTSPIIDSNLTNPAAPGPLLLPSGPTPWYETDWGIAGIGLVATGTALLFDHGINQYANTKFSYGTRRTALHVADVLELAPLAFSLATMVQSPVSDPELAHASSIAVTSAAEVTAEAFVLKYAIGRSRPAGANSSPYSFYPFNASKSTFSVGAVFPGQASQTSSFPSGHTILAFALVTPYAEIYHAPELYAIPVAVAIGRIMSPDGHWASDVIGGGFLGWLTADLTRRYFPNSDYGLMIIGDGQQMMVGLNGRF